MASVLIVEDEFLIARALRMLLVGQGARIVGPVARVDDALALVAAERDLGCALLDVKLGDEPVFPVADVLRARGVRFAFLSGYDRSSIPAAYQHETHFSKVEDPDVLIAWVMNR